MTGTCLTHSSCCACLSLPCLLYSTSSKMKIATRAIPSSQMAIDCSFARSQPKRSKMVQRSGHMAQYCRIYHQTRPESACQMLLLSATSTNVLPLVRTLTDNGGNSEPKENLTELRVAAVALKCRLRLQPNSPKGTHRENFSNCNSPVNLQVVCRGFDCGPAVGGSRFFAASGSARPGRTVAREAATEIASTPRGRNRQEIRGRKIDAGFNPSNGGLRDAADDLFVDGCETRGGLRAGPGGGAAE